MEIFLSRNQKKILAQKSSAQFDEKISSYCFIHGIAVVNHFSSRRVKSWIEDLLSSNNIALFSQIPMNKSLAIYWAEPANLTEQELSTWNEDPESLLEIAFENDVEFAAQRDFVGFFKDGNCAEIFCKPNQDNGFYNALRWILPRYLIQLNSGVFHSSAFVDSNFKCHIFLGPSGIGKTTVVSRLKDQIILGDDMILVSTNGKSVFAETPILGQNPRFKGGVGSRFPVVGFYFLKQGNSVKKRELSLVEATKKTYSSFMYPTWQQEKIKEISQITKFVDTLVNLTPMFELTLDLNTPFLGALNGN